jgi:hypothetical protein
MTPVSTSEKSAPLLRRFGLVQATALNMSNMIGVGPFISIPLYPLPSIIALVGWIFIFATTAWPVILLGLGTLSLGAIFFFVWSWYTERWPFTPAVLRTGG